MQSNEPVTTIELPDDIESCHSLIIDLFGELIKDKSKITQLEDRLRWYAKQKWGDRSDRISPGQLALLLAKDFPIEEASSPTAAPVTAPNKEKEQQSRERKGHSSRQFPPTLPVEPHDHTIDVAHLGCPECGTTRECIGEKEFCLLDYKPGSLFVRRHTKQVYSCQKCKGHVIQATAPGSPIAKGEAGAGLIAHVITSKFGDHLPLYRLEDIFKRQGMRIARSTMCDWLAESASILEPLYELMKKQILGCKLINTDDTILPTIDKRLGRTRKARIWVYVGDNKFPCVVYDYTETRERTGPREFLKGFKGFLQADAFAGYDCIYAGKEVVELACMAHAKRKLNEAAERDPRSALPIVLMIDLLYEIEREGKLMIAEERLALRQEKSVPILAKIKSALDALRPLPKSTLGRAVNYALANWAALERYTTDGDFSIDNNVSERAVKPVAIGRKNFLFAGNAAAGKKAAILYTLVQSCKRHGVDPWSYLTDVLERINDTPTSKLHQFLPDEWKKLHPSS